MSRRLFVFLMLTVQFSENGVTTDSDILPDYGKLVTINSPLLSHPRQIVGPLFFFFFFFFFFQSEDTSKP